MSEHIAQKFLFPHIAKVLNAFSAMAKANDNDMGDLIIVIVACGIRREPEELENMGAEEALDLFNKVMEVNKGFFTKFAKDVPKQIEKIFTFE